MAKSLTVSELIEERHDFCLRIIKKFGSRVENKLKRLRHRHEFEAALREGKDGGMGRGEKLVNRYLLKAYSVSMERGRYLEGKSDRS